MKPYTTYSFEECNESPLVLFTQIVAGDLHYDFKLAAWHETGGEWHFEIRSVKTSEEHKEQLIYLPFSALPELRQKIVEILEEHDGSQPIDEMPTIPEWAKRGFFNSKFSILDTSITPKINQLHRTLNNKSSNLIWSKKR
jgi:hypothetical protein